MCKTNKSLSEFYEDARRKDGYWPSCKPCTLASRARSNKRVKERDPDGWRKRQRAYQNAYKARHPERVKAYYHKRNVVKKFGLTPEQYSALLSAQGGVCVICGTPPTEKRRLAVDHDHATGKVRGLLCGRCNLTIGALEEDTKLLDRAKAYLLEHR